MVGFPLPSNVSATFWLSALKLFAVPVKLVGLPAASYDVSQALQSHLRGLLFAALSMIRRLKLSRASANFPQRN